MKLKHVQRFESFTGLTPLNEKNGFDLKDLTNAVACFSPVAQKKAEKALMDGDKDTITKLLNDTDACNESVIMEEMASAALAAGILGLLGGTAWFNEKAKKAKEGTVMHKIAKALGEVGKSASDAQQTSRG